MKQAEHCGGRHVKADASLRQTAHRGRPHVKASDTPWQSTLWGSRHVRAGKPLRYIMWRQDTRRGGRD
eukprot:6180478-Pleurochrysis_carterae.AAC.1